MILNQSKRRGAIHMLVMLPIILGMMVNFARTGHVAPRIHDSRMSRFQSGKPVLFKGILLNSHENMLAWQGAKQTIIVLPPAGERIPAPALKPMPQSSTLDEAVGDLFVSFGTTLFNEPLEPPPLPLASLPQPPILPLSPLPQPPIEQAPAKVEPAKPPAFGRYTGGPAVVFVRCNPRAILGANVCYEAGEFGDVVGSAIVVSVDGLWRKDLPSNATDAQIREAVSPPASPFQQSSVSGQGALNARPQADGPGGKAAGPQFHSKHQCPNCGASQYVVSGAGPQRGTHLHTCPNPRCNTTWFH